jgi:DNA-directed RNA polymerase specialized sigma24 family protein
MEEDKSREEKLKTIEDEIQKLIANRNSAPTQRSQILNKLFRLLYENKSLFAGTHIKSPNFDDAWSKTMEHFLQNLWEVKTEKTKSAYCETEKIVSRLRSYLIHRINDENGTQRKSQTNSSSPWSLNPLSLDAINDSNMQSILDTVAAPVSGEHLWLHELVELDERNKLKSIVMKGYPKVNCQNIILMFLQGYSWREIATNLNVPEQALYSFMRRQCLPLMYKEITEIH